MRAVSRPDLKNARSISRASSNIETTVSIALSTRANWMLHAPSLEGCTILLSKILSIKGVGILDNAVSISREKLTKRTLIYAENGRGKSTLSAILTSCSTRDSTLITDRLEKNPKKAPEVELLFNSTKTIFSQGSWSGHKPEMLVFDGTFVEKNVHAGNTVTSAQRMNLLDFALGESAVQAREREEEATNAEREEKQNLKSLTARLEGLLNGKTTLQEFRNLPEDLAVGQKIAETKSHIDALNQANQINRLRLPETYSPESPNFAEIERVMQVTLDAVHEEALRAVSTHLRSLSDATDAKSWIQRGLELESDDTCPYCGQDTSGVQLVEMYRHFFDKAYAETLRDVEAVYNAAIKSVSADVVTGIQEQRRRNNERIEAWSTYINSSMLAAVDDEEATGVAAKIHSKLDALFAEKKANLSEVPSFCEPLKELRDEWVKFERYFSSEEAKITSTREKAEAYKEALNVAGMDTLVADLANYQLIALKQEAETQTLLNGIETAEREVKKYAEAKKSARSALNSIMSTTLGAYMNQINSHLADFGAEFQIAEFKPNHQTSSPSVQYSISLKGSRIPIDGGTPKFATALSEGDKRTMAFAFFAASTLNDVDLSKKIVLIDDPMSSLDASRRARTIDVIDAISQSCEQLILTAHDEFFLQETRDRLRASDPTDILELTLNATVGEYSDFSTVDLDRLCASTYSTHYQQVTAVVNGTATAQADVADAAQALRPLLEGYLYRKFPRSIKRSGTLGDAIAAVVGNGAPAPMFAQVARYESDLRKWNNYASQFHHDTNADYAARSRRAPRAEVVSYGRDILEFIHSA